jgi:hypothetical protein
MATNKCPRCKGKHIELMTSSGVYHCDSRKGCGHTWRSRIRVNPRKPNRKK